MKGKVVKLETGTVYQKTANGSYYFRYQINGQRKAVSLQTKNQRVAVKKAKDMIPIVKATTTDVISAHVKQARGLTARKESLALANAWGIYSKHPERATPATVSEQEAYHSTWNEFIEFAGRTLEINNITPEIADRFAQQLRSNKLAVDTHNRKIRRLKKIFEVLSDYRSDNNPFIARSLRRKEREEQEHIVRRVSFTRDQEVMLLEALDDDSRKVKNKPEIRIIYHLGMFTGQRLKDCVLLRWDKVDLNRKESGLSSLKQVRKLPFLWLQNYLKS